MPGAAMDHATRPFATRLLIAALCVYTPFVVIPFLSTTLGCDVCAESWLRALPTLPGRYPALMLADAVGATHRAPLATASTAVLCTWLLVAAWVARETRAAHVASAVLSLAFATVTALAFAG